MHVAIATNTVAVSVNGPRADTTIHATDQSGALNVRSWGKWGERHCGCGSGCSNATQCGKSNECKFEFQGFLLWMTVWDVTHTRKFNVNKV